MNIFEIKTHSDYQEIKEHFLSLSSDDRYLRFGNTLTDNMVISYIDKTQEQNSVWFCVRYEEKIIGTIHVAIYDTSAEFGITVSPECRGKGIGKLLFAYGYRLVIQRGIKQIYLYCLSQNKAIQKIAKSFGIQVITCGTDAEASVTIHYPVPLKEMNKISKIITMTDPKIVDLVL